LEYLEGEPDFAPADPPRAAAALAAALARIHRAACLEQARPFLPPGCALLSELAPDRPPAAGPFGELSRVWAALRAATPFPHPNPPALLHGDFWPGNLLWKGGQLNGVIDWEDACPGDPLADLAITRLDLLTIYGRAAMEAFTMAYRAQTALDWRGLPYWDLCAALRLARLAGPDLPGWAAFFQPCGRADISPASILAAIQAFVSNALFEIQGV